MYHCFRLRRGQDLYEEIEAYVKAHHIAAGAVVSGAVSYTHLTLPTILLV